MKIINSSIIWLTILAVIIGVNIYVHDGIRCLAVLLVVYFISCIISITMDMYIENTQQARKRKIDDMIAENLNAQNERIKYYNNYHNRFDRDDYVEITDDPSILYNRMVQERQHKNELGGYNILGIEHDDSDEDVKKAYRKLMSSNHPDKLESKHLSAEMMRLAKEKTQQYIKAYKKICKERGM